MATEPRKLLQSRRKSIAIGKDYQADIPEVVTSAILHSEDTQYDTVIWAPNDDLTPECFDKFVEYAIEKHGYNIIQSLGLLSCCEYNIDTACEHIKYFTPLKDVWSESDRDKFKSLFMDYGDNFKKIQSKMPNKTIDQLIHYYYSSKECRELSNMKKKVCIEINLESKTLRRKLDFAE